MRWRLHSILVQPKSQGSLSPQLPDRVTSFWEGQGFSVSLPVPGCLLLRLSPGWMQLRGRGILFPSCPSHAMETHPWTEQARALRSLFPLPELLNWWFCPWRDKSRGPQVRLPTPSELIFYSWECHSVTLREVCHCPHPHLQSPGLEVLHEWGSSP